MKSYKIWLIIGCVAIVFLLCTAVLIGHEYSSSLTLTAQAILYVPSEADSGMQEYADYTVYQIAPNQKVNVEDDRKPHEAEFRKGILNTDFRYGPLFVRGSFPLSELKGQWESIPLEDDWPFYIYLFNTNEGRAFQVFLDLEIHADQTQAKATLRVFYKNKAYSEPLHWSGKIGEEIKFTGEV